jgi:hypothetical protein
MGNLCYSKRKEHHEDELHQKSRNVTLDLKIITTEEADDFETSLAKAGVYSAKADCKYESLNSLMLVSLPNGT